MDVLNIQGYRWNGSLSLNALEKLREKAVKGQDIGLFEKLWDKIKDRFLGTHIGEAKSLLLSILSDNTPGPERLTNFRKLQRLERPCSNPALVELAQTDGASIRIMASRGGHVEARRSVCLYECFIPLPMQKQALDLEWDQDAGAFVGTGLPWLGSAMEDDTLSLFDGSSLPGAYPGEVELASDVPSAEEYGPEPLRTELWMSAPNTSFYRLLEV